MVRHQRAGRTAAHRIFPWKDAGGPPPKNGTKCSTAGSGRSTLSTQPRETILAKGSWSLKLPSGKPSSSSSSGVKICGTTAGGPPVWSSSWTWPSIHTASTVHGLTYRNTTSPPYTCANASGYKLEGHLRGTHWKGGGVVRLPGHGAPFRRVRPSALPPDGAGRGAQGLGQRTRSGPPAPGPVPNRHRRKEDRGGSPVAEVVRRVRRCSPTLVCSSGAVVPSSTTL